MPHQPVRGPTGDIMVRQLLLIAALLAAASPAAGHGSAGSGNGTLTLKCGPTVYHYNKDPEHSKIPLNHRRGIAPALLPAVGYQMERSRVQVVPLGTAGLLLTFGVSL
jgi:hypothetical protein